VEARARTRIRFPGDGHEREVDPWRYRAPASELARARRCRRDNPPFEVRCSAPGRVIHRPHASLVRHSLVAPLALTRYLRLSENARAVFFLGRTGSSPHPTEPTMGTKVKISTTSPPVRQPARCCPRKRHVWGTRQSRQASATADGFAV
jgi:hypothetical protein